MQGVATQHAPAIALPLLHILTGVAAALLAGTALFVDGPALLRHPFGDFRALAVTHLLTLGWLALTAIGASYQLVPVVLEVPLRSTALAWASYPLLVAGTGAMVAGFWLARPALLLPGAWATATVLLVYVGHLAGTVLGSPRRLVYRRYFLGSLAYLAALAVLGGLLAASLRWGWPPVDLLPLHVVAALLGWATLLAMGVAYKLVPMFALSHGRGEGAAATVFALAAGGSGLLLATLALGRPGPLPTVAAALPAAAVALFLRDQWLFFRSRRRPWLDPGLRLSATAFVYLGLVAGAGWLATARGLPGGAETVVLLALTGWLGCLLAGQTYKIVPFLVWYGRYASRAGRARVPLLREMYEERLAGVAASVLPAAGLLLACGAALGSAVLERTGALAWLIGYGILAVNLVQVLRA
jgi:hypothetical protein